MSKFWAAGGSDDSSSSSDSSDASSSSDDSSAAPARAGDNRWVMDSDSDSEESVRVVKSAKTRAFEAFETNVKSLRNAMRIQDHKTLMEEFDTLTKSMIKSKKVFESNGGIPRFLVRMLVDMEDHVARCLGDKAAFKKLKPAQGRALNRMKLGLKKFVEPYKGIMAEYRKNPVISESEASDDDSSSSSSSSDDEDSDDDDGSSSSSSDSSAPKKKKKAAKSDSDSDSDSDDSGDDSDDSENWDSDSSSDSSDDDSVAGGADGELKGRARWLKRTVVTTEKVTKDKAGRSEERKRAKEEAAKLKAKADEDAKESGKLKEEDLTPSSIQKRSLEIVSSRGRKGSDPKVLLGQLETLSTLAARFGPRVEIPVLMHVITAQFDMQRNIDDYMETPMWRSCAGYIERVGSILSSGEGWQIGPMTGEDEELATDMMMSA
eukprot:CAMPEP_0181105740 /NCGR_PEP_ID=MMETSP1071-20121207/16152_1 /TAXON_ID=35127 /ORGANISM="Thalassiosira sp., Strain NH16" /LENGTH=432 /DNA_ID=CAMNT_0023189085 /DNA_START=96 /DNA_END=1390 /DNA_ORIENTATION=-